MIYHLRFTIYHLRFTIYDFLRSSRCSGEQARSPIYDLPVIVIVIVIVLTSSKELLNFLYKCQ